jgi:uncharacterized membrane-anchored protein
MQANWSTRAASATVIALTICAAATATSALAAPAADRKAELAAASEAAKAASKAGPLDIPLGTQATLKLPEGYTYIPHTEADALMKAMGNGTDPSRLGMIVPPGGNGFIVPRYIDAGYIKDEEANDWKADELLQSVKDGTEEGNKDRREHGIPELDIVGWAQKPTYDRATHRLVWAIESKDRGTSGTAPGDRGVNYNTYVLGREGYLSMNLVSGVEDLAANKPYAAALLANTSFNPGKTYADFKPGSDRVAEFGIAALVTGVVAKKLGLFAVIAAFALKFAKIIAVAAFALFAGVRKFFKRDKAEGTGA